MSDVLGLLQAVGQVAIHVEADTSAVLVSGSVTDEPWDCVLQSLAEQLSLVVVPEDDGLHVRRESSPGAAKRP